MKIFADMRGILLFFLMILGVVSFGQQTKGKDSLQFVQMTGIVITDSMYRVPFTKVYDMTTGRGVLADYYGYFALVVHPGDTIQFKSLGYKTKYYVIEDTMSLESFSLVQVLEEDTLMADPVDVYPWMSKEQFDYAFVHMDIPNDDIMRARERLTPQEMAFVGALMTSDGSSSYSAYQQQYYQDQYTRGQGGQNNLLNPSSWAQFINGIGTGAYRISQ